MKESSHLKARGMEVLQAGLYSQSPQVEHAKPGMEREGEEHGISETYT